MAGQIDRPATRSSPGRALALRQVAVGDTTLCLERLGLERLGLEGFGRTGFVWTEENIGRYRDCVS